MRTLTLDEIIDSIRRVVEHYDKTQENMVAWEATKEKNNNQTDLIRSMAKRNDGLMARNKTLEREMAEMRSMGKQLWLLQFLILDNMTDLPLRLINLFCQYTNPLQVFLIYSDELKIKGIGSYYNQIALTAQKKFNAKVGFDIVTRLKETLQAIPEPARQGGLTNGKR